MIWNAAKSAPGGLTDEMKRQIESRASQLGE